MASAAANGLCQEFVGEDDSNERRIIRESGERLAIDRENSRVSRVRVSHRCTPLVESLPSPLYPSPRLFFTRRYRRSSRFGKETRDRSIKCRNRDYDVMIIDSLINSSLQTLTLRRRD